MAKFHTIVTPDSRCRFYLRYARCFRYDGRTMTSMTASPLILLTGATGFVGRQVLRVLKERGCRVRAVVRDGKKDQIAAAVGLTTKYLRRKPVVVGRCVSWVDTVIHAAWYVKPGQYLQSPKNRECYSGTLRLAEGARQANVRRFVGIGTCFEYDLTVGYLSIATPLKPSTAYARRRPIYLRPFRSFCRKTGSNLRGAGYFISMEKGRTPAVSCLMCAAN